MLYKNSPICKISLRAKLTKKDGGHGWPSYDVELIFFLIGISSGKLKARKHASYNKQTTKKY